MAIIFVGCIGILVFILAVISFQSILSYESHIHYVGENSQVNNTIDDYNNASDSGIKIGPPEKGVYHSALTNFGGLEDEVSVQEINSFEKMTGKKIVWAYFSNNWDPEIVFPEEQVRSIHKEDVIPFIRMMPRTTTTDGVEDPVYTLQGFIDGKFDEDLRKWAKESKRVGIPIMVEFGTEVNGDWFPWSGILNGAAKTDGYGDRNYPDGPERFRDAYRHIIDLFRDEGVTNITWAFHVYPPNNVGFRPQLLEPWNNIANYYPGDDYIDWMGTSIYGAFELGTDWDSFSGLLNETYPMLTALSDKKPIAVFEFGVLEDPLKGNKTEWVKDALKTIESGKYPRLKAISYWDERWTDCIILCIPGLNGYIDLRLNSSQQTIDAYKKIIASPFFVSQPTFYFYKVNQSDHDIQNPN
jgi:Glycosyl hydrolase family 26